MLVVKVRVKSNKYRILKKNPGLLDYIHISKKFKKSYF